MVCIVALQLSTMSMSNVQCLHSIGRVLCNSINDLQFMLVIIFIAFSCSAKLVIIIPEA